MSENLRRRHTAGPAESADTSQEARRTVVPPSPRSPLGSKTPRSPKAPRGGGLDDLLNVHPLQFTEEEKKKRNGSSPWWLISTVFTPLVSIVAKLAHAVGIAPPAPKLTAAQLVLLDELKEECARKFEPDNVEHQLLLHELWRLACPGKEFPGLKGGHWKEMGWQGDDPVTDLRTAGHMSMCQLVHFGQEQPETFAGLLHKRHGKRSDWEYPFAIAGVNITYMLIDALGILPVALGRSKNAQLVPCAPFFRILQHERKAFTALYALAFARLDREWVHAGASYMQFNEIMARTRAAVEKALNAKPEPKSMTEVQRRLHGPPGP